MDIVFLHGGNHGSWCWDPVLPMLRESAPEGERLIMLDMPGCGQKRGRAVDQLTLAAIVKELNEELRSANVSKAVLVGHSIAGVLLPMMAAEDPSLYAELIYLTTSAPLEGQTIMEMMGTALHGQDPEQVGWPLDPATTSPQDLALAMFAQDLDPSQIAWLMGEVAQDVTPPAVATSPATRAGYAGVVASTYIVTLRDNILPADWQRRFAERLGCERIVEIDTPHEPFVSHPVLLAETLRALLPT